MIYDPVTQELQFINTQTDEHLYWGNDTLTGNFQLTENQWAEFQELSEWLDDQGVAPSVELGSMPPPVVESTTILASTAAQLFEYYASQEVPAYKLAEDSTIHYYSVAVDGLTYRLSRDDATGDYNLQREETGWDVQSHQGITQRDRQTWLDIEQWLLEFVGIGSSQSSIWENFDWESGSESIVEP